MNHWLIKTEPSSWSWAMQKDHQVTHWDGVRNYQASNNLKAMTVGDQAFFYHSVSAKSIMGVVEIVRSYYPDFTDTTGRFGMVDVKYLADFPNVVTLEMIKNCPQLQHLYLVRQSRLSVMPIDPPSWTKICQMGAYV